MKQCVLLICLSATGALFAAQEEPAGACKNTPVLVCIDRTQPVTPLAMKAAPNDKVTIRIHNKSPFEKISFTARYAETPDEQAAAIEKLFRLLSKIMLNVPLPSSEFEANSEQPPPPPPPSVRIMPVDSMLALAREQERLNKEIEPLVQKLPGVLKTLNEFVSSPLENRTTFDSRLDSNIISASEVANLVIPTGAGARLLYEKVFDPAQPLPLAVPGDKLNWSESLDLLDSEQKKLEARLASLEEARDLGKSLAAMFKSLQSEELKKEWFAAEKTFHQPANRKASIEITATPLRGGKEEKLAAFDITWAPEPKFALSLGLAMSWVAKQEFANETLRDPAIPLTQTTPSPFTYRIGGTQTKPLILPMTLIHYPIKDRRSRRYGFAFTGGAGVNLSGDSPTGELALGGSLRIGNAFVSPLLHFGRQRRLADGFNLHEPTLDKFVPPAVTGWKRGFALAITYRLPL